MGKRISILIVPFLICVSCAGAIAAEKQPKISKIMLKSGSVIIGPILSDTKKTVIIFGIKSNRSIEIDEKDILKKYAKISDEEAVKNLGLPVFLAWKIKSAVPFKKEGLVAKVTQERVYINLGTKHGIENGMRFKVYRLGEEIKDPETGKVLGMEKRLLCQIEVVEAEEKFCKAKRLGSFEGEILKKDPVESVLPDKYIAVLPLVDLKGNRIEEGILISEQILKELVKRKISVVERSLIEKVIAELAIQNTFLFDPRTAQEIGRQAGAFSVLTGTIAQRPQNLECNVRLINVATGKIIFSASEIKSPQLSKNRRKVQTKVSKRTAQLRPGGRPRSTITSNKIDDDIERALNKKVTLRKPFPNINKGYPVVKTSEKTTVLRAARFVVKQVGLKFDWDKSLNNTTPICRNLISPNIQNMTCEDALKSILTPYGLAFEVQDGKVVLIDIDIKNRLDKIVTYKKPYPTPYKGAPRDKASLQYAVIDILNQVGLRYNWNESYKNTDPICRRWIYPNIDKMPCKDALEAILEPNGLTYYFKDGEVVLVRR